MRKVGRRIWLAAIILLFVPLAATAQDGSLSRATPPQLKRIWDRLTPQEQESYRAVIDGSGTTRPIATLGGAMFTAPAADDCPGTAPVETTLPFGNSNDSTGAEDDYLYGDRCACSDLDAASGRLCTFPMTGAGPDVAYRTKVTADCTIRLTMNPTDTLADSSCDAPDPPPSEACTDDLAVYVMRDCLQPTTGCVGGMDEGKFGTAEVMTFSAVKDVPYFIVVDGFGEITNRDQGPFELTIEELVDPATGATGCALIPVGLDGFSVE